MSLSSNNHKSRHSSYNTYLSMHTITIVITSYNFNIQIHYIPPLLINPLNPKFFSFQTTFSPHMPLMHLISISVQALTQKLHPCPLLALISSLVTLTTPLINEHVIVSTIGCHTPAQRPSSHSCQKPALCKVRVVFSKPVHAVRAWGGPPVPTMAFSKPSLAATMCTAPYR